LQAIKTDSHQHFYDLLYGLLREGQLSGEINPDLNLDSLVAALMAVTDGLMLHSLVRGWGVDPQRVRRIIHETFSPLLTHRPGDATDYTRIDQNEKDEQI
jgi:hypothetical protein